MGCVLVVGVELVELVEELVGLRDLAQYEMGCVLVVGVDLVELVEELLGLRDLAHETFLG